MEEAFRPDFQGSPGNTTVIMRPAGPWRSSHNCHCGGRGHIKADVRTKLPVESLRNYGSIFASGGRGPATERRRSGGAGLDMRPG